MNIFDVKQDANEIILNDKRILLPEIWLNIIATAKPASLKLGIRPENVILSNSPTEFSIPVKIQYVEDYGNRIGLYFTVNGVEVISILPEQNVVVSDRDVYWNLSIEKMHFFDGNTEKNLGYPTTLILK
jgi:sn-glycerol 3-phosphate transport system ATP-binding protein